MKLTSNLIAILASVGLCALFMTKCENVNQCEQPYSTVAVINTDTHLHTLAAWKGAMHKQNRVISEYNRTNEYSIIQLRDKKADKHSMEVNETVYVFFDKPMLDVIEDSCPNPITKILYLGTEAFEELNTVSANNVKILFPNE